MTDPQREDWAKLIAELKAHGVSAYKLSQMLGVQLFQVQRWIAGSEPKHFIGERIRSIHAEYVSRETLNS